jgi:hypothetical protein
MERDANTRAGTRRARWPVLLAAVMAVAAALVFWAAATQTPRDAHAAT